MFDIAEPWALHIVAQQAVCTLQLPTSKKASHLLEEDREKIALWVAYRFAAAIIKTHA